MAPLQPSIKPLARKRPAARGITLIELALSMMIMAVLSVGVSSLIKTGVETQMSERMNAHMQTIAMNIVDDIRLNMRTACTAQVTGGGTTLNLQMPPCTAPGTPNGFGTMMVTSPYFIYKLNGTDFVRTTGTGTWIIGPTSVAFVASAVGPTKIYNKSSATSLYQVDCNNAANVAGPCFTALNLNSSGQPKQIVINNIRVTVPALNSDSIITKSFNMPPNYSVRNFSFDVMNATEFQ